MRIRIIATPPGQAPLEVREEWVGLELDVLGRDDGNSTGVLGGAGENQGGYMVWGDDAVEALAVKSPAAAHWWEQNAPWVLQTRLVFKQDVCEEIG
jgi:hypothetical protein